MECGVITQILPKVAEVIVEVEQNCVKETLFISEEILTSISPVFKTMLESQFQEASSRKLTITDIDIRSLEAYVNYICQKKLHFTSIQTAVGILYMNRKYLIDDPNVSNLCLKFLENNLNQENVLYVLQNMKILDCIGNHSTLQILQKCYHILDRHGSNILQSDNFEDISLDLLKRIISRDSLLLMSETEVYTAINRWAGRQCSRHGMRPSSENKRHHLQGCQYLVRYLTMNLQELKLCLSSESLLLEHEIKQVTYALLHFNYNLSDQCLSFPTSINKKRTNKKGSDSLSLKIMKFNTTDLCKLNHSFVQNIVILLAHILD